jgi:hypothetical protein
MNALKYRWNFSSGLSLEHMASNEATSIRPGNLCTLELQNNYRQGDHIRALGVSLLNNFRGTVPAAANGHPVLVMDMEPNAQNLLTKIDRLRLEFNLQYRDICLIADSEPQAARLINQLHVVGIPVTLRPAKLRENDPNAVWARLALVRQEALGGERGSGWPSLSRLVMQALGFGAIAAVRDAAVSLLNEGPKAKESLVRFLSGTIHPKLFTIIEEILCTPSHQTRETKRAFVVDASHRWCSYCRELKTGVQPDENFLEDAREAVDRYGRGAVEWLQAYLPEYDGESENNDRLTITYPNAAKGFEYEAVICLWQYYPDAQSINAQGYRRRLFSAMGRARSLLVVAGIPFANKVRHWLGFSQHCELF